MASFPTHTFNGNVSSQKGYYVNNILIAQTGGSNNVVDINPNGATGSGTANQLTFFHNSDKGTTTPYILIDNTSTSSTQTASVRFLSADGNTTYGSIVGNTTGLNFNNNSSIGYITMTLGTGSTSSTLNFVKPDNSLYGSIVGNTTGLNLTSTSNLNIAGSGASSIVQINNFKTLIITGVDATSSVQISNITSLNAPGLGTLTTSQVGTPLVLDSNNNIKGLQSTYIWYKSNITDSNVIFYIRSAETFSAVSNRTLTQSVSSFYNYSSCTVTSSNWTPIWGTTSTTFGFLYFPYTGVYIINWSFGFDDKYNVVDGSLVPGDNINYLASICKNYSLASPTDPHSDPTQAACESSSPDRINNNTLSATITIENAGVGGDYIVLVIHNSSPSLTIDVNNIKGPLFITRVG